jgi:hypothetical protein
MAGQGDALSWGRFDVPPPSEPVHPYFSTFHFRAVDELRDWQSGNQTLDQATQRIRGEAELARREGLGLREIRQSVEGVMRGVAYTDPNGKWISYGTEKDRLDRATAAILQGLR